jgi:hypothetical protein
MVLVDSEVNKGLSHICLLLTSSHSGPSWGHLHCWFLLSLLYSSRDTLLYFPSQPQCILFSVSIKDAP